MILVKPKEISPHVAVIQILLKRAGCELKVDGIFGPKTSASVIDFKLKNFIVPPDAQVEPSTWLQLPRGSPSFNPDTVSRRSQAGALVAENPLLFGLIPPSLLYHHGLYLKTGFVRTFRHLSYKKRSRDLDRQQQAKPWLCIPLPPF